MTAPDRSAGVLQHRHSSAPTREQLASRAPQKEEGIVSTATGKNSAFHGPIESEHERVNQVERRSFPLPSLVSWAQVGAAIFASPIAARHVTPSLGAITVGAEVFIIFLVIAAALFGSDKISGRAFRLLRLP